MSRTRSGRRSAQSYAGAGYRTYGSARTTPGNGPDGRTSAAAPTVLPAV